MYWTGMGYALSTLSASGALILMYHSIASAEDAAFIDPRNHLDPDLFETQISFLARSRRIISIDELTAAIAADENLPPGTVVISFDDGYRDNLEIAAPILQKHGLPAVLYLPTAMIDDGENPWVDELYTAFRTRGKDLLEVLKPAPNRFDLSQKGEDRRAYLFLANLLLGATRERRREVLDEVHAQLAPRSKCPLRPLNWDELREMRERFPSFTLGLHSDTHLDLTAHGLDVARDEIRRCKATFRRELGQDGVHFAYPYNRNNPQLWDLLRAEGIKSAVSSGNDCAINCDSNPMSLPRVASPESMTLFRLWTQGSTIALSLAGSS